MYSQRFYWVNALMYRHVRQPGVVGVGTEEIELATTTMGFVVHGCLICSLECCTVLSIQPNTVMKM